MKLVKQPSRMHFAALVDQKNARLQPPPELGAAQQAIWHQTVNSLPTAWFGLEQVPVLQAYVCHTARLQQLEQALSGLDPITDLKQFGELAKLAAGESAKIAMHARSMRLTQQSRFKAETASSRSQGSASAANSVRLNGFDDLIAR